MTGTLAAPLARAINGAMGSPRADHGIICACDGTVGEHYSGHVAVRLRENPEVLAALAEALHHASRCSDFADHTAASHNGHAAALLDALFGPQATETIARVTGAVGTTGLSPADGGSTPIPEDEPSASSARVLICWCGHPRENHYTYSLDGHNQTRCDSCDQRRDGPGKLVADHDFLAP